MAELPGETEEVLMARFEELGVLEAEFEDVELEIIRKAEALHAPLYQKRADYVKKIPHFWSLVFEQAPPEIDNFIQPSDSKVFAECFDTFEVSRFELDDPNGSPRSFLLRFGFKENEYFEDKVLEKKFWFRKAKDWAGLVSEPVQIHWKKGKDLTGGLTDAAFKFGEARKKLNADSSDMAARKKESQLPEYKKLADKIETSLESSISFFGLFAFVSGYRWVSAEESAKVEQEDREKAERIKRGEKVPEDEDEDEEDAQDYQEIEVFPGGDEVVTILAEDMWPNAIKYYKSTFDDDEEDDEDVSDVDVEAMVEDGSEDESEAEDVDMRALVGQGRKAEAGPPAKKQRKNTHVPGRHVDADTEVLANETDTTPPIAAAAAPALPPSPASPSPASSALPAPSPPLAPSASAARAATPRPPPAKRRHSLSESDQEPDNPAHPGRSAPPPAKRRRRTPRTMRLDTHDASKRSRSPSQTWANGSSRASGLRSPRAKTSNGDPQARAESNGSCANGGPVANGNAVSPTFYGHDREEVTRILIQSLTDLGYHGAAGTLCKESGFQLEGPTVASFRASVLNGEWARAEELLFGTNTYDGGGVGLDASYDKTWAKSHSTSTSQHAGGLTLAEGADRDQMLFWMKQQKYLELLERRELAKALTVLRQELTPLHQDVGRLHALSSLLMCQSAEDLKAQAQWDGARGESRIQLLSELSKSISPSVMIPEHRLSILLDDVKNSWISNCLYHNTAASPSLYLDHKCERDDFPTKPVLELKHHTDEVWFVQYSHDGTMLASSSSDSTICIYDTKTYKVLHQLDEHQGSGVSYLAWSPDDSKMVSCCAQPENAARIWDVKAGVCITYISDFTYPCTTAAWAPSGKHVVIGSQDDKTGCGIWDLEGQQVHNFSADGSKIRANDLAISPDGQRLVVVSENSMIAYDFVTYDRICEWRSDDVKLTSVAISKDSRHMLVSMSPDEIKLMEIDTGDTIRTFKGHSQKQFIIRSVFGGANESFVVSGSEDSKIYIWRSNGQLVEKLDAHIGCANSVAWHPKDPTVFASAGDDQRVRIWRPVNAPPIASSSGPSSGFGR
ncbi:hypothetical protein ACEQ8H_004698 [Pleosporales sp. CAS-2024a]